MQKTKRTRWPRLLCLLLSLCMIVGMLPTQAFAGYDDDPITWPAPDSQYTAPGRSPLYLYFDRREDGNGHVSHACVSDWDMNQEIVKATATTDGYIKAECTTCGSWAKITIPTLTLDAFELDPAYQSIVDNGMEYSGEPFTLVYKIRPDMQRFLGTLLENNFANADVGTYYPRIVVDGSLYDNVELTAKEALKIYPKGVPWMDIFYSRPYDGTNYMADKSVSYTDVKGQSVNVGLSVMLAKMEGGSLDADSAYPVAAPIAAGLYIVSAEITDKNYAWLIQGNRYSTVRNMFCIYPVASTIYADDPVSKVTLTTGSSAHPTAYTWNLNTGYSGFDSSKPGTTEAQVTISRSGAALTQVEIPVTVIPRPIIGVEEVVRNAPMGTAFNSLNLPATLTVTAEGGTGSAKTYTGVPVTWNSAGYNANTLTQTVKGTLNLTNFPQLTGSTAVTATVNLTYGQVEAPSISDYSKAYDKKSTPLPLPSMPQGIQSTSVAYKGTANNGNPYNSGTAPVNAGTYTATVSFVMAQGYPQLSGKTVNYIITKAPQTCDAPTLAGATTTSLTLNTVDNAEYSIDGDTWQDSPVFPNLDPGTTYTLYQRLKATDDGNYDASPAASAQFATEFDTINPGDLNLGPQSYPYTGNPIPYHVPTISGVTGTSISYNVDGTDTTSAPVNAGPYPVKISFTVRAGMAQVEPVSTTLTITKISQNPPSAPKASNTGTNSITIVNIPGAVFSIDGGKNWQTGTLFDGLDPDKDYTIQAKYPEDRNHYESAVSSSVIRTTRRNTSAATVQSAVYTYDGEPKSLVVDQPIGCTKVVQTFTGINGTAYGPTREQPVNPGVYNVKVSYTMESGYEELQPQYATLTIIKATPKAPDAPVVTDVTDSSITIIVEPGLAYSIDGGKTWQTSDTFTGLTRDTNYEIKVKVVENAYYTELEGPSTMQKTLKTKVVFEGFNDQTVEFTGYAQTYTLPRYNTGISSMSITGYNGQSTIPVDVGDYEVTIAFVAADGYELPDVLPTPTLHIVLASGSGTIRPKLEDETVTYNGAAQRYHGADGIEGIASMVITYSGINGTEYAATTTAPTNAGTYLVTVLFTPDKNHALADGSYTAVLTIRKAAQDTPLASLESATDHSLTASAIPGAEYSIDGGETWQDSNIFTGLDPDTDYTILVRMKEDENHDASGTRPVPGHTTDISLDLDNLQMPDYSTVYNGNRQPYPYTNLLTNMEGVRSVSVMYVGTLNSGKAYESSEAPVDAGTYKVRFYLTAEDSYELTTEQVYANMTIAKAPQTMDTPPTIARRTTTTIALNPVPGAEYSIDGGKTWQDSNVFTGLTPDTSYTFTQRLKETYNLYASDAQSVEGRTVADTGLGYEIDFREETIHFDTDVVEIADDYEMSDTYTDGDGIIPGDSIFLRLIDDGTGEPGNIQMDILPERPATPDVKVNPNDFTMNTTEAMEYSDDGGKTWHPCDPDQLVEDRQGETLLVRIAATDNSFKSEACTVTVPERGIAPVLKIDNATERMDCTSAMEYSRDGGETWIPCVDDMSMSDMVGETLLVRYSCDGINPASNSTSIRVPTRNAAPMPHISTKTELLTADGVHVEYRTESGWTDLPAAGLDVSGLCGQEVTIRESYDDVYFASLPVTVTVPRRGEKPDITIDRDNRTADTTPGMEWSDDGGKTWHDCDKDMDVSDKMGQDILVREKATDDQFASEADTIHVPGKTEKPDVKLDTYEETIDTTTDMDYSPDGGKTWYPCEGPLDVSGMTGDDVLVRNHDDEDHFPSDGVEFHIPERRDAPPVRVDRAAETVTSDDGTQWSADGGKTWHKLTGPLSTEEYAGKKILFRYPATDTEFVSRSVTVIISNSHKAPVLTFDPKNETVSTTTDMEWSDDGGKTWHPCTEPMDVSDKAGEDIWVRYPGDDENPPSDPTIVHVPERRDAPNVGHTDETRDGRKDGTLTETDKTMEYRLLPDGEWTAISGDTVKGLAPGTYEVRYAADTFDMASFIQKVVIAKGSSQDTDGSKLYLLNQKDHIAYISGRTSTQAAPNADITRAEVAEILYRLLTAETKAAYGTNINRFKDVPADAWYNTAVSTLSNLGVITGYQDGTFAPQRSITRAELATILARFCGDSKNTVLDRFSDISGSWARKYINQAAEAGLVNGYADGTFRPDRNITRAETIAMVNRILGRSASAGTVVKGYKTFSDVDTGAWYYWDVIEASNGHDYWMGTSAELWTALW